MASHKVSAMLGQSNPLGGAPVSTNTRSRSTTIAPWDDPPNDLNHEIPPFDKDPQALLGGTRPFNQDYFNDHPSREALTSSPHTIGTNSQDSGSRLDIGSSSQASEDTVRSRKSGTSSRFQHKNIKSFFGDDPVSDARKGSVSSKQNGTQEVNGAAVQQNGAFHTGAVNNSSDASNPTANIAPWDDANIQDVSGFGSGPARQDSNLGVNGSTKTSTASALKRTLLHRHRASKDESRRSQSDAASRVMYPQSNRNSVNISPAQTTDNASSGSIVSGSSLARTRTQQSTRPEATGETKKGGLLSRLRGKTHKDKSDDLEHSSTQRPSVTEPFPPPVDLSPTMSRISTNQSDKQLSPVSTQGRLDRESSVASVETVKAPDMAKIDRTMTASSIMSKAGHKLTMGRHKTRDRTTSERSSNSGDHRPMRIEMPPKPVPMQAGIFSLDTNFDDMSDIVRQPTADQPPIPGDPFSKFVPGTPMSEQIAMAWDAPDSWAIKGQSEDVRHHEIAEHGLPPIEEEDGVNYFMRVFRQDGTFATLSMTINATVAEVLQSLAKKTVLHDTIENYHLLLRKNQLTRQLDPSERPIAMQKKLLLQAGYEQNDEIEEVGREDNSYLCRFTFSHEKQTGFGTGLDEKSIGSEKLTKVDLTGLSLLTIPIILYKRAAEIIHLNLSRNLALTIPKDFISACVSLKEIKFTGNEARKIPSSLAFANRLEYLDLSNNRITDLEHAELHRLTCLVSLKMPNNQLSSLPVTYAHFRMLRSLNLSSNSFTEFPEHMYKLRNLLELDISFNKITTLPKIAQLKTLERLWITNNGLKALEEGFKELKNLKEIDARFNQITSIDNVAELPDLELLFVGHNNITSFKGSFRKMRTLLLDHCPMTEFDLIEPVPSLITLDISSAKLVEMKDSLFEYIPNLQKLSLDKNHFSHVPSQIGRLSRLEYLSMAKNRLDKIPASLGNLVELRYLNLRECNVKTLPAEIWYCRNLELLNLSSNVMETFPKANSAPPPVDPLALQPQTPGVERSPSFQELGKLEDFQARRPSNVSGFSMTSSPSNAGRKGSVVSIGGAQGRKMSQISRTNTEHSMATATCKESNISQGRLHNTFAGSLKYLYLADNRLEDDVFRELGYLQDLRMLNLSYNDIDDFPSGVLKRWPLLTDLYLSGNALTSLPSEDFEESSNLRSLYLNGNRFQVLPAELCNVHKLAILDVGSNFLKYNVSNWPYDWNWNKNLALRYLNLSANRRLEIKPATHSAQQQFAQLNGGEVEDLTSFNNLKYLRVLGLMDVTLLTNTVPDDNEDRRVRTSASLAGPLLYGMADTLGNHEHLSLLDLLKPNYRGHDSEIVVGMFDGTSVSNGGSKVTRYLHENFHQTLHTQLARVESPLDALRRSFLHLNKDMANHASNAIDSKEARVRGGHRGSVANSLSAEDLNAGCTAVVLYFNSTDLYVANVGDIESMLIQSNGKHKFLTRKHSPADEKERIQAAGGYVSRQGKLNDEINVSRAFGYFNHMPSIIAAPSTFHHRLSDIDELIVTATRELWDFVTVDLVIDLVRAEKGDLMIAAQKLRDLAMAYGARDKMMIQILGVQDLKKRASMGKRRGASLSMARELAADDQIISNKQKKRPKIGDSELARMEEPEAPTGEVAICFTDIKNSTALWEILPVPMRGAIQLHNQLMRRQLRIIGGYEVKTEGDAFMCSFPTVTSALLWCFECQQLLLELEWPQEILETVHCREKHDSDGNLIYRGLSVRMGIHWGRPVCEADPITRRMDYFGPMVNKSARVSAVADGGQISVSSDAAMEFTRAREAFAEHDTRRDSGGSGDVDTEDPRADQIRRELAQLSQIGFEVKELGEKKLKGLENPEFIYLMFRQGLAGRMEIPPGADGPVANIDAPASGKEQPGKLQEGTTLEDLQTDEVWQLWDVALRLEMLCSALEDADKAHGLHKPESSLKDMMKERGGVVSDTFMLNLLEHQVTRVENCVSTLQVRHMIRPLVKGKAISEQARPMQEVLLEVAKALGKWKTARESHSEGQHERVFELLDDEQDEQTHANTMGGVRSGAVN